MIEHFFDRSKELVMRNIKDRTGQSVHVDDYLGSENSSLRKAISGDLDKISRQISNANSQGETTKWLAAVGES